MANTVRPTISAEERRLLEEVPERFQRLREQLGRRILGQNDTIDELLLAFLAGGHVLVVGVPGLAKTLMIRTLSELLDLDYARIQFTPDLMPSDITGTTLIHKDDKTGQREFQFQPGPIFTNLLLADEINRTPPKTQSALLEAMEEYQVTVSGRPRPVPSPFFVLATQNPIEQEGTYPLPVTQLDRFMFQIDVTYPVEQVEFDVIATTTAMEEVPLEPVLRREEVEVLLRLPRKIEIPAPIIEKATKLSRATRPEDETAASTAKDLLSWGAGPRASNAILAAARAAALLAGRDTVAIGDYQRVVESALRHRILRNYHAEAEGMQPDNIIREIRREIGDLRDDETPEPTQKKPMLRSFLQKIADPMPRFKRAE